MQEVLDLFFFLMFQARANLLDVMLASSDSSPSSCGSSPAEPPPPPYSRLHRLHRSRRQKTGMYECQAASTILKHLGDQNSPISYMSASYSNTLKASLT